MLTDRKYGWRPGLPSRRFPQLKLQIFPPLAPKKSLLSTGYLPPIWDQGSTGSCTGHGTVRGMMYARAKQKLPFLNLSRLFPYYNARVVEGDPGEDNGAAIGDVVAASQKLGDCLYDDYPTKPELVATRPSTALYSSALQHKSLSATRVMGSSRASLEYHFKHCLSVLEVPIIIGIVVYDSFESDAVAQTGMVPIPENSESELGGHCIAATEYDDSTKLITCDNSWGVDWGLAGRFKIPYDYIFDPGLASDFHAILLDS